MNKVEDLTDKSAEAGILASLFYNPDLIYYSEQLQPSHFTDPQNQALYRAMQILSEKKIERIDAYIIMEAWSSNPGTQRYVDKFSVDAIQDFIQRSSSLRRTNESDYKLLVYNVLNLALRRDTYTQLRNCMNQCLDPKVENIEQVIYDAVDGVMTEYATRDEFPQYKDLVDECWREIQQRQSSGCAGIPFQFPLLNEYATIEKGELFIFAAAAKEGKSMMLLNCAVDLLKQDKKVLYLDSELNTRLFTARMLSYLSNMRYRDFTAGNYAIPGVCTQEEGRKIIDANLEWLKTRDFTHIYIPMFDERSIYTAVKKIYHTQGIDVLIVDYFKGTGEGDAFNSYQELGRFVDTVKNKICGDMNICGLGAAQATTTGKLADSQKIGRNASTIALLQTKTPEEIEEDGVECGNKKLRIVLNRNGAQMAEGEYIDMFFDGDRITYRQADKQHDPASHSPF